MTAVGDGEGTALVGAEVSAAVATDELVAIWGVCTVSLVGEYFACLFGWLPNISCLFDHRSCFAYPGQSTPFAKHTLQPGLVSSHCTILSIRGLRLS